jgi:hypothetical protein
MRAGSTAAMSAIWRFCAGRVAPLLPAALFAFAPP